MPMDHERVAQCAQYNLVVGSWRSRSAHASAKIASDLREWLGRRLTTILLPKWVGPERAAATLHVSTGCTGAQAL